MKFRHLALAFVMCIVPPEHPAEAAQQSDADFFHALAHVESNHNDDAIGDGGASIGRYQIQRAYWQDAVDFDKSIGGKYEDVKNPAYAEKIMRAYWRRYAREAYERRDWEVLSRVHNGGPSGHKRDSTKKYWEKVKKALDAGR